jgi:ribonucleoside-diphosphate reductase alpha chain
MNETINVVKRSGEIEELNLDKIHVMVEEACKNLSNVSASQVEIHSDIQFYNGITTKEIQEILIKSANDLISLENTNYQYVAARLLLFSLRKNASKNFRSFCRWAGILFLCVSIKLSMLSR